MRLGEAMKKGVTAGDLGVRESQHKAKYPETGYVTIPATGGGPIDFCA